MNALIEKVQSEMRGAWRFRRIALITAWGFCGLGWLVVLSLPDKFESSARVNVDTRTALRPLLQGIAVEQDVEAQLNLVKQTLLGRANLDKVASQVGLDSGVVTPSERNDLLDGLTKRITLALEAPTVRDPRIPNTLYRITYTDTNRDVALRVVDVLLNSFVEDTMGKDRASTASAERFLREQLADYDRRLADAETKLAEFKKRNFGLVPGAEGDHFSRLTTETQHVKRLEASIAVATSRRAELQRQLRGETPYVAPTETTSTPQARRGQGAQTGGQDTASRIQEAQARLDDLLLRFTDRHPDVIATRETLEQLKKRQLEEIEALKRGDPGTAAIAGAVSNPVYQNIQLQMNQVDVDMAAMRSELADHRRNEADLRRMVDTAPEVEAEYSRLTRDYDVTKTQYNNMLERLEKARVSGDAEETGVVRFNIVDPPSANFEPIFPNRPLLLVVVLVLGLALGAGIAYLQHMLRPVFSSERSLAEVTGLPVLGVVARTFEDKYRSKMRAGLMRYSVAAGLLLVSFVTVLVLQTSASRFLRHYVDTLS
jgi:polysaccharide chain length determinant protein (PEP-CTERM system associated)